MPTQPSLPPHISDALIERLIAEDVPYLDLTTWLLEIGPKPARIEFFSREPLCLAGSEEVARLFARLGVDLEFAHTSGESLSGGQSLLRLKGRADALHLGWKVGLNILEYASGVATRTRRLVELARQANPRTTIVTTRKGIPGCKELATRAVLAGGGLPHRLGLSETVLIFQQHRCLLERPDSLPSLVGNLKAKAPEKKILVEVDTLEDARTLAAAGIDGVQFDKVDPETLKGYVESLKATKPGLVVIAAGGINDSNATAYANTGADALATSWVYYGKPADIRVAMTIA